MKTMQDTCIRCGSPADINFRVLPVRTLHVRDLDRAKKVQALGDITSYSVCRRCAEAQLMRELSFSGAALAKCLRFGAVLVAGAVLLAVSLLLLSSNRVFVILSLAAIACGAIGCFTTVRDFSKRAGELRALPREEAVKECAWSVLTGDAPKKDQDVDITYIPITEKTLARKNGDLMILYDLLPEIAVEAWKRIHDQT